MFFDFALWFLEAGLKNWKLIGNIQMYQRVYEILRGYVSLWLDIKLELCEIENWEIIFENVQPSYRILTIKSLNHRGFSSFLLQITKTPINYLSASSSGSSSSSSLLTSSSCQRNLARCFKSFPGYSMLTWPLRTVMSKILMIMTVQMTCKTCSMSSKDVNT